MITRKKRKGEITGVTCRGWTIDVAWERAGFKNRDALYEAVRNLPIEEKVELLTNIFISDMAKQHFEKKGIFLRRLGHKTWVDSEDIYEYAKITYTDSDDVEWKIDPRDFSSYFIDSRTLDCEIMDVYRHNRALEETQGKKIHDR